MVGLDLLTPARCGCDQLRERGDEATGRVGVHDELAQDRSKLRLVDVAAALRSSSICWRASWAMSTEARTRSRQVRLTGGPGYGW
ncbi:hypothetical protein ACFV8Z_34435 [Streptomyces sp. NPDC059837]|uniref:hypothetical protein n=1 Tax=unclassified Streptomyces TaxID=2593676 RepID=UPI002B1CDD35|nr:hypothetical protein [Streptomyces sp. NBC_01764]